MSTTTTESPITSTTVSVLTDYELQHSEPQVPAPRSETPIQASIQQPADWPVDHLRVPPYRPINRNLDWSERSAGSHPAEVAFVQIMLHGVWINAAISRLWHNTLGRVNDRIFRYEVGGEW
ncbi:hypothetical protein BDV38DRAFT_280661 [Aspergillus pseudotamarii]|uniref:Uncharacterized protein n=1 Tax=Aspergillus pseudotamarii TaxID=132259 RepID=A0A5N6SYJ7_ASPPS|nr:uncharacterized protein BDV38DRAFT_280661 [Aspergillus pseudotamarii]KAE8139745.1 hypothetical protein BDV38DRAFT_280661 [Aspergillus pseudotamarii]